MLLQVLPEIEALYPEADIQTGRVLIVQYLHKHLPLCIPIENHLQVGSHWQKFVHRLAFGVHIHQRQQTVKMRVVTETEIGPFLT